MQRLPRGRICIDYHNDGSHTVRKVATIREGAVSERRIAREYWEFYLGCKWQEACGQ
jgi:hypothetical protein